MKSICAFILLFAIACSSIFGLMNNENEKFIQGKWQVSGEHKSENGAGQAWYLEWEFENGKFKQFGYPPILQEGNYKVSEVGNETMKLKLYKQKGTFGEGDSELIIVIDKENNSLNIDGKGGFTKQTIKKIV
jgi:hypothetical protein